MKLAFDFNLEAWIAGVEIEGNTVEECFENLNKMTVEEMLETGYAKLTTISEETYEVIEDEVGYKISNIKVKREDGSIEQVKEFTHYVDFVEEDYVRSELDMNQIREYILDEIVRDYVEVKLEDFTGDEEISYDVKEL